MSVDQVVTGQIHRGVMHGVDKVGLHHGVVGVLHRIGCVNHIYLQKKKKKNSIDLCVPFRPSCVCFTAVQPEPTDILPPP